MSDIFPGVYMTAQYIQRAGNSDIISTIVRTVRHISSERLTQVVQGPTGVRLQAATENSSSSMSMHKLGDNHLTQLIWVCFLRGKSG